MKKKELLFTPKIKGRLKKSALYIVPLISGTISLCIRFLFSRKENKDTFALADEYIEKFWRRNFEDTGTSLYVTGRENLTPGETYVFMSNHESWMDIPAMFGAVPSSLRMVAKLGLSKVPIFGSALKVAGFIPVDRKNLARAIKQLDTAKMRLREGTSIWIAPEGTRTRNRQIAQFKKGGFYLARELGKSIVPVFIEGAAEVIAPDTMTVNSNRSISVHFCAPISTKNVSKNDMNSLIEKVRNAILKKKSDLLE